MKQLLFAAVVLLTTSVAANAQGKYLTKTAKIDFLSKATVEDIQAINKTAIAAINSADGSLEFQVQMKGFEFEKAMMQQHFNDNYVESGKYPQATFSGRITNNAAVNYKVSGTYPVKVAGKLTLHGVTNEVEAPGTITIAPGKAAAKSTFTVQLSDYKVAIPAMAKEKISNTIKITVDANMDAVK